MTAIAGPKLKRASVTINYTTSDGRRSSITFSNRGCMGRKPAPELPLVHAMHELKRLQQEFAFTSAGITPECHNAWRLCNGLPAFPEG